MITGTLFFLRFACGQDSGRSLEIFNNGFEQGIPVLDNDGSVKARSFYDCACCTDGEAIAVCMFSEPGKKQAVAVGLTPVAVIAHIEKHIKILQKELVDNSQNRQLDLWVVGRAYLLSFFYDKLIGFTPAKGSLFFKRNSVVNSFVGFKNITSPRGKHDVIDVMAINAVERELNHSDTIVPLTPLRFHSSSMRLWAARLISSERLKRARASSYVTSLTSILIAFYDLMLQR